MRPSEILNIHRDEIKTVMAQNEYYTNLRVFGSVADGTDTDESDIDFLVDCKKSCGLLPFFGLKHQLEDILKIEVDLAIEEDLYPMVRKGIKKIIYI